MNFIFVPKGTAIFVPYGWFCLPIYCNRAPRNDRCADEWTHYIHLPRAEKALVDHAGHKANTAAI